MDPGSSLTIAQGGGSCTRTARLRVSQAAAFWTSAMSVPDTVREQLRRQLWHIADRIGWIHLPPAQKSRHYEDWTRDPAIGGILARYIDMGQVRVYLKDSLLKDYLKHSLADEA